MLRKIDGFKHLYKELFKEFERLMKERDSDWKTVMSIKEKPGWRAWT